MMALHPSCQLIYITHNKDQHFITATKKGDFEAHLVKSHDLEVGEASSTINDCGKHNNELYHTGDVLAWTCTTIW